MRRQKPSPSTSAVTLGAALLAGVVGCSSNSTNNNPSPDMGSIGNPSGTFTATSATGSSTAYLTPLDTVPSSDGSIFYFTAQGKNGLGVFKVPAAGGTVTELFSGTPLVSPLGIAISSDDQTLYIADSAAGLDSTTPESLTMGMVYQMPVAGGTPQSLSGSAGTRPRGITVSHQGTADVIYFTGNDPTSLAPALFTIAPGGGAVTTKASGAPFNDPGGVTVSSAGDAYVSDSVSATPGNHANIIHVTAAGSATVLTSNLIVGAPAGLALTRSENLLLVSGRDPSANTDVIYQITIASPTSPTLLSMGISGNTDSGGLHRAAKADIYSWADLSAGTQGTVYNIVFK